MFSQPNLLNQHKCKAVGAFTTMLCHKRIINACQQCKERKGRCDGGQPCCSYCSKHEKHCIYTVRRRRGPGKSKESTKPLIQQHDQGRYPSVSEPGRTIESEQSRCHEEVRDDTVTQDFREGQAIPRCNSTNKSTRSPYSISGTERILPTAVKQFIAFSEDIRTTARQMQARIQANQSCFERRKFTSLPPEDHAVELIRPVIEEVQLHGVFLTTEDVLKQLVEQYRAGVDECSSDPSRWATLCSFLAMSAHHRTASGSVVGMSSIAWAFFKNAFAMYVELAIVQRPQISTCEALLAMTLFMLRTADACVAARLTATVAQSVYMLGLHKYEHYIDLDAILAERQKMIFWVTYVVNADLAHRDGTPSSLDVDNFDIAFPGHVYHHDSDHLDHTEDLIQTEQAIYLRRRAVLAVTQLRIHKVLQQALSRNAKRKLSDIEDAITAIDKELQAWKHSLPISIQPGFRSHESPLLEMPIAMLHYIYFSCISKVSMVVVLLARPMVSDPVSDDQPAAELNACPSSSQLARAACVIAAREILRVQLRLQWQPLTHLWQTLCFPLSAFLILLSEVLAHPASVQARTDAHLIHDFVQYLERLQKEGGDVRDLLDGCKKFYNIAMRSDEQTATFEQTAEIQLLRSRFAQVTDWLQLAQGLLSNMAAPHNQAREIFSDILGPATSDATYGAFVPAFMKSSTHNFSFGV